MRLSDGVEWGVHACTILAVMPTDRALPAAKLAEYHGVPAAYLAKHLQALARAGVLETVKGPRGGYRLARPRATSRCSTSSRRSTARSRRSAAARSAAAVRRPCPRGSTRSCAASTARSSRADEVWRAELARTTIARHGGRGARGRAARRGREERALAQRGDAREPDLRTRCLATGTRLLAVVGLVAAGPQLALLRLLAHGLRALLGEGEQGSR